MKPDRITQIAKLNASKAWGHGESAVQHVAELLKAIEAQSQEIAQLQGELAREKACSDKAMALAHAQSNALIAARGDIFRHSQDMVKLREAVATSMVASSMAEGSYWAGRAAGLREGVCLINSFIAQQAEPKPEPLSDPQTHRAGCSCDTCLLDALADDRAFDGYGGIDIDTATLDAVTPDCSEEQWRIEWRKQMRIAIRLSLSDPQQLETGADGERGESVTCGDCGVILPCKEIEHREGCLRDPRTRPRHFYMPWPVNVGLCSLCELPEEDAIHSRGTQPKTESVGERGERVDES